MSAAHAHSPALSSSPAAASAASPAASALALQAELLGGGGLVAAAHAWVRALAAQVGAERVALALAPLGGGPALRLVAVSDGSTASAPTPLNTLLLAACAESFDQQAALIWPVPTDAGADPCLPRITLPRITLAQQRLVGDGGGVAVSLPLVAGGEVVGALCVQAHAAPDVSHLQALAALAGPVLALLQAEQHSAFQRLRRQLARWWAAPGQPRQRALRRAAPWGAMALLLVLGVPVDLSVGGHARLEGAVQRVLSAPADGFVQQVHARPGDVVQAGQPLLDLADQDLLLERQRWQSQLAQHLDALAGAQARADRAALVQHQSQADAAQAELDLVDEKLQRARLVAPFDAVVVQGDLSQQLGAPVKLGAELMTLAPAGAFRVIVEVDERDIAHVQAGQSGTLALSALPWDTLALRLTRISPVARAVEGRNVFEVEAELLQRPVGVRPGLQGQAHIAAGQASTWWRWRRAVEALRLALWRVFG